MPTENATCGTGGRLNYLRSGKPTTAFASRQYGIRTNLAKSLQPAGTDLLNIGIKKTKRRIVLLF